ncbi:S9 family peptidase [Aureibaculum sp. 2210JD6-5]|uniref:S9 family peptidase n=1 Tax=Aureibaculum sp. 2210JD6-5 TaxID=3103957 RepID=UPI002AAE72D5|nr:S9 family peptidase [Aureibaculum sp. 2210JD6-5]MDY7395639.1 S9 family peptidase [Aureibaculum sp. 2210JD6-5]
MIRYFIIYLLFISTICFSQTKTHFQNLDVFELEWAVNPEISPDGSHIVYQRSGFDIMNDKKQSRLWMMNADGSNHVKLTSNEVNESNPKWSPDGTRIAFTSSTENGSEIFVYWLATGKTAKLTQLEKSPSGLNWSPNGKHIAFLMTVPEAQPTLVKAPKKPEGAKWAEHPRVTTRFKYEADGSGYIEPGFKHLFVISADGGTAHQISSGNYKFGSPHWAKDGKSLFFSGNLIDDWDYDFRNSEIYNINIASGKTVALTDRKGPDGDLAISPNGKQIAYVGFDDKVQTYQVNHIYLMDLDGSNKRQITMNLDRSPSDLIWSNDGKGLYFQYDDKGNTKIGYTTLSGKTSIIADNLGGTAIGRPYGGGSYSVAENGTIAFTQTTPNYPSEIAVVQKGKTRKISKLNDDILPYRTLGKVEEIWYKSTIDGNDIQGWIVYPPNFDASKKYPLLVENHGGPISNYGDRFSPEMQLYASAGYVVFYPNPRGSTSYGEKFGNLLYHNYPGNDYDDVMDGVDAVIAKGIIDTTELFVTGGSAGGIMTAWMIGKNNRFRAAAVIKPVMNWISKTLTADNYYGYADSRYPGQPWENFETYWKFSPISLVGNIQTPTMVMVGTEDRRTPLSEAKQLYNALKIRKIETALVEIPGAYHLIVNRPSQLITKVDHIVAWFEKYREE